MDAIHATRQDTISRAIALIDSTAPADLDRYLAQTDIHDHLKADTATLRQHLADAAVLGNFGAWKAAQQILRAARRPY